MKCSKCNHEYDDNMGACPVCGEPKHTDENVVHTEQQREQYRQEAVAATASGGSQQQSQEPPKTETQKTAQADFEISAAKNHAIASLVCGILGFVIPFVGVVLSIVAIVLGASAKKELPESERGMATAGFVLGIVSLAISVLVVMTIASVVIGTVAVAKSVMTSGWLVF